jgi:hypothetical protein
MIKYRIQLGLTPFPLASTAFARGPALAASCEDLADPHLPKSLNNASMN